MQLNNKIFDKLIRFVDDSRKNKNYELEARFFKKIDEDTYNRIFQRFTFTADNNGFYFPYTMKNMLDVSLDKDYNDIGTLRMTIHDNDNIKKFWLDESTVDIEKIFIEKEKIDKIDEKNYNIRFSLNNEISQNELLKKNIDFILSSTTNKTYRMKNRYSIKTDDNLFVIDMSAIKMGRGNNFSSSNTIKENLHYEIEIEFIGKDSKLESSDIAKKMLYYSEIILKLQNNSNVLISQKFIQNIKSKYFTLVKSNDFIAASPVTIHRENLLKSNLVKNICENYAVTLKADGERNFLFVVPSEKKEENGKIYMFNNNFNFIDTGYKDDKFSNTLIECEYVKETRELYIYDILFFKNRDVRRTNLYEKMKECRVKYLIDFDKSPSRTIFESFTEQECIKIQIKQHFFSNEKETIFMKAAELWKNREQSGFHVDGMIFIPKNEYYKLGSGSWYSLFKWKPPHLNSIDFLIKSVKDDNNKDVKSPTIQIVNRIDGTQETVFKQYKTYRLYVTRNKGKYNNGNVKKIPVLFNPYGNGLDDSYNSAQLFIEKDEKTYAHDPISKVIEEIGDDIIVEFGYDDTREVGFKWVPYRYRRDKTDLYKSGQEVFGNNEKVAMDIFKSIHLPVTEEMITTGNVPMQSEKDVNETTPYYMRGNNERRERFSYQNFHNHYIKYQLFYDTSLWKLDTKTNGKFLDLCCGKGVDIKRIKKARYSEVVGIDVDYNNIIEAQELYKKIIKAPPRAYYLHGDASKLIFPNQTCGLSEMSKKLMLQFIPSKYIFDTVSLQFCFHYFFKSEVTFRTLLQNMNDNLKIGGHVIGTTFDGQRIHDAFIKGKTDSLTGMTDKKNDIIWKIDKKYKSMKMLFKETHPYFGYEIDVLVKTIGVVHKEYLVNFNYFDAMMIQYGFEKVIIKPFSQFYDELTMKTEKMDLSEEEFELDYKNAMKMSEDEKRFSFFSNAFIYKKVKNTPDIEFKKLSKCMEKEFKEKEKEITAYKMDKDEQHLLAEVDQEEENNNDEE
jgi:SAM-dependent methyltransferase